MPFVCATPPLGGGVTDLKKKPGPHVMQTGVNGPLHTHFDIKNSPPSPLLNAP